MIKCAYCEHDDHVNCTNIECRCNHIDESPDKRLADSGDRTTFFENSAQRDRDGEKKYRQWALIPWSIIRRLAIHFGRGSEKYDRNNWAKGMPLSEFFNSAMDHMCDAMAGKTDEDHEIAAIWNMVTFAKTREMIERGSLPPELDDRSPLYAANPDKN